MTRSVQADGKVVYTQTSLTREQKEAVGLLSIGTILEYFDLMLYVHMAVLLNELFFEPTNPESAGFMTAIAFCSSFVFRPVGAVIFGWLGDNFGRKTTIVITTFLMALSCIMMAILPTYAQIGFAATVGVTLCRIVQSISSMGEVVGAKLYLTELLSPPIQYPVVTLIQAFAAFGGLLALGVATIVTSLGFDWRNAFWIGAIVAFIGSLARTRLRETPDFADAKLRVKNSIEQCGGNPDLIDSDPIVLEKVNYKTAISLFLMDLIQPVSFYFTFVHCSGILKSIFHYSAAEIIRQNVIVSIFDCLGFVAIGWLSYYINPLLILRFRVALFSIIILICPIWLNNISSPTELFFTQSIVIFFALSPNPACSMLFKRFPVFKRFTYTSMSFALSRSMMYAVTAFGMMYLTDNFGNYGLLIIMLPATIAFALGLSHFRNLEKQDEIYNPKVLV